MARGKFITFEGPEGAGKSTHLTLLAEHLRKTGLPVITTREPGGTPLCESIRELLQFNAAGEAPGNRAEVLLFLTSRAQLVERIIRPALERGTWVLCDRFCDSTFAYQGFGRAMDLDLLRHLNAFATHDLMPDRTIFLDIPQQESRIRLAQRQGAADRFEAEQESFHARILNGFRVLAKATPERILQIDSSGTTTQTESKIWNAIKPLIQVAKEQS